MKNTNISRRDFIKKSVLMTSAISLPFIGSISCDTSTNNENKKAGALLHNDPSVSVNTKVDVLLKNAVIIDVKTGNVINDKMILIKNNRILDIISNTAGSTVTSEKTYDLKGNYIIPGLINAHTHMSMPCSISFFDQNVLPELVPLFYEQSRKNALECVKHGVTTVRDMGAMYNICEKLKGHIQAGEIPGPRIITSSVLDVTGSFMSAAFGIAIELSASYFQPVNSAKQAVKAVADAKEDGMGWIKLYHQTKNMAKPLPEFLIMSDNLAKTVCDEARRQGMPVAQHVTDSTGFAKGLNAGVTTFEHIIIDREFTKDDLKQIIDKNISFIPTVTVGYALCYKTKNDPDWSTGNRKWMADERSKLLPDMIDEYLVPEYAAAQDNAFADYSNPDYFNTFELQDPVKLNPDAFIGLMTNGINNIAAINDAGVRIGCGNDGGMPLLFPGAMGLEMHLLKKCGYAPADILKMATINNAEILGLDKDLGTIEKGKIADLAVFAGNPLDSFENTFKASYVFQAGKLVYS
jgi:imidazolonepropionase-like amidohydrolase